MHDDAAAGGLTERDRRILDFEAEAWRRPTGKIEAIREEFGLTPARYYRILGALVETPEALRYDPMLVKRLLRQREARRVARAARSTPSLRPFG